MSALYPTRDRDFHKALEQRLQDDSRKHVYGRREDSLLLQNAYPELLSSSHSHPAAAHHPQPPHAHTSTSGSSGVWRAIGIKQYQILKKVGSGTYGSVFHSKSPCGVDVAIKQLSAMQNDKSIQDGFHITAIREIKILKSLHHTNIISLHDVICDKENVIQNYQESTNASSASQSNHSNKQKAASSNSKACMQTYMIFEYMHHDLSGLLHNEEFTKSLNIRHIKYFLCQIFNALEYCHDEALILHRDIKSSNLLVDNYGVVKIADFGLARQFIPHLATSSKRIAGQHESVNCAEIAYRRDYTNRVVTLWYRAPELLLSDQHYTPSVDMWSVGCVFAELLFNKPIFQGQNEMQQWFQIVEICGWEHKKEEVWMAQLRDKDGLMQTMKKKATKLFARKLKHKFKQFLKNDAANNKYLDDNGFALLDSLLTMNPNHRCSAKQARLNEWFKSDPFPTPPTLNHLQSSHDYEQRQARKNPNYRNNVNLNHHHNNNNNNNNNNHNSNQPRRYQYSYNQYQANNNSQMNHARRAGNHDRKRSRSRSRSRDKQVRGAIVDERSRSGSLQMHGKDNSVPIPPPMPRLPSLHANTGNAVNNAQKMVVTLQAPSLHRSTSNLPNAANVNNTNSNSYKQPWKSTFDPNQPHTFYSRFKKPDELKGRSRF